MHNESTFRTLLLLLTLSIYAIRLWHVIRVTKENARQRTSATLSTVVMTSWFISLLAYASGFAWFDHHLPFPDLIRWIGAACMFISFPLALWFWMRDTIADYFGSRIALSGAYDLVVGDEHQLWLDPVYATFIVCALGAIMLSANGVVLPMSIAAIIAMTMCMKRESRQLA